MTPLTYDSNVNETLFRPINLSNAIIYYKLIRDGLVAPFLSFVNIDLLIDSVSTWLGNAWIFLCNNLT